MKNNLFKIKNNPKKITRKKKFIKRMFQNFFFQKPENLVKRQREYNWYLKKT